ncbi:MAG: hypothetical protein M1832_006018 [Thelocarpon impressellum]|nr:MAG: hypothetical protein M1832_006018 [Thelocarpon impressellum]
MSPSPVEKRKDVTPADPNAPAYTACDAQEQLDLEFALLQVNVVAELALMKMNTTDLPLFSEFFGDVKQLEEIRLVFERVAAYPKGATDLVLRCDGLDAHMPCQQPGSTAMLVQPTANQSNKTTYVDLCSGFFGLPTNDNCMDVTAPGGRRYDRAGVLLRQLVHAPVISGWLNIGDGPNGSCYSYECVAGLAKTMAFPPSQIAAAYELFGYATRRSFTFCQNVATEAVETS